MNAEFEAHRSDFPGFPEGPFVLVAGRIPLGCDHLLLRHRHRVQEGLHRRLAEAPTSLMRPVFIVLADPQIQVGLQLVD